MAKTTKTAEADKAPKTRTYRAILRVVTEYAMNVEAEDGILAQAQVADIIEAQGTAERVSSHLMYPLIVR